MSILSVYQTIKRKQLNLVNKQYWVFNYSQSDSITPNYFFTQNLESGMFQFAIKY